MAATGGAGTGGCVPGPHNPCGPWQISEDVTLLPPGTPGGIEILTVVGYMNEEAISKDPDNPMKEGLKSYSRLVSEGRQTNHPLIGRNLLNTNHRNYIFFRAPYHEGKRFKELYFPHMYKPWDGKPEHPQVYTVLVDPEKTYVYDQDARTAVDQMFTSDEIEAIGELLKDPSKVKPRPASNTDEYYEIDYYSTPSGLYEKLMKGRERQRGTRQLLADYLRSRHTTGEAHSHGKLGEEHEIVVNTPVIGPEWFVQSRLMEDNTLVSKRIRLMGEITRLKGAIESNKRAKKPKRMDKEEAALAAVRAEIAKIDADYLTAAAKSSEKRRRTSSEKRRTHRSRKGSRSSSSSSRKSSTRRKSYARA